MADKRYRWLDSDAAERLLRAEPLDAVDDDAREHAARLAGTLAALAVTPPPAGAELPGEAAALAAFRAARTAAERTEETLGRPGPAYADHRAADAGLVRLGRSAANGRRARWGRPLRFGLAAAVAAGMIGGVAVAAGTGVLPTPFHEDPGPGVSVSAAASPPQPLLTGTGGPVSPAQDAGAGSVPGGSPSGEAGAGPTATGSQGPDDNRPAGRSRGGWTALRSSCRDVTVGRELRADRLRDLQDAAGGSGRVKTFCEGVLGGEGGKGADDGRKSGQDGNGRSGVGGGEDGHGDDRGGGGDDHGGGGGDDRGGGGDDHGGEGKGHTRPDGSRLSGEEPSGAASAPISAPSSPNPG
ncbi:hypothetical protein ACWD5Q_07150 [Streptomyces sp. NPDC002513]